MKIIVHAGQAHMDDILSVGLIKSQFPGETIEVFRRDPTREELDDPAVWVVDAGMTHNPVVNNYDHHQLGREAEAECAFSLLAREFGLEESLGLRPWFRALKVLDSKGPFVLAKELGLGDPIGTIGALSPVQFGLVKMISPMEEIPSGLVSFLGDLVGTLVDEAREFDNSYEKGWSNMVIVPGEVEMICFTKEIPSEVSQAIKSQLTKEKHQVGILVAPSDREGESYLLYRYDDNPKVDFSVLEGEEGVLFAHKGGFIAKLAAGFTLNQAIDMATKAIKA